MERDAQRYHGELFSRLMVPSQAKAAWASLYSTYRGPLVRFLTNKYIRHDQETVYDIVSTVFVELWMARKKVSKLNIAKDWLFKAAKNKAITYLEAWRQRPIENLDDYADHPDDYRIDLVLEKEEEKRLLHKALARLPPGIREVMKKKYMEDMKNQEIARSLGKSPQTIGNQVVYGKRKMKHDVNILDLWNGSYATGNDDPENNRHDD